MDSNLNTNDQRRGSIGAKFKRQNAQKQAKRHAEEQQQQEPIQQIQRSNEEIFRENFGINTIVRDWSLLQGIIGEVLKQHKDYCWAIVFARLMQAIYNQGLPINQQNTFSFLELLDHIMPEEDEDFALTNLKIAFDHIADKGMLKKPIRERKEKANAKGVRIKKTFHICEDVDASFIREKLDQYPVGLILEPTVKFLQNEGEIYYLPKKKIAANANSMSHCLLIIGYGITTDGELYFIGQNSWGNRWGCRGYVRIIINQKCDIFCLAE